MSSIYYVKFMSLIYYGKFMSSIYYVKFIYGFEFMQKSPVSTTFSSLAAQGFLRQLNLFLLATECMKKRRIRAVDANCPAFLPFERRKNPRKKREKGPCKNFSEARQRFGSRREIPNRFQQKTFGKYLVHLSAKKNIQCDYLLFYNLIAFGKRSVCVVKLS